MDAIVCIINVASNIVPITLLRDDVDYNSILNTYAMTMIGNIVFHTKLPISLLIHHIVSSLYIICFTSSDYCMISYNDITRT